MTLVIGTRLGPADEHLRELEVGLLVQDDDEDDDLDEDEDDDDEDDDEDEGTDDGNPPGWSD
jgi:hypothetical protein